MSRQFFIGDVVTKLMDASFRANVMVRQTLLAPMPADTAGV